MLADGRVRRGVLVEHLGERLLRGRRGRHRRERIGQQHVVDRLIERRRLNLTRFVMPDGGVRQRSLEHRLNRLRIEGDLWGGKYGRRCGRRRDNRRGYRRRRHKSRGGRCERHRRAARLCGVALHAREQLFKTCDFLTHETPPLPASRISTSPQGTPSDSQPMALLPPSRPAIRKRTRSPSRTSFAATTSRPKLRCIAPSSTAPSRKSPPAPSGEWRKDRTSACPQRSSPREPRPIKASSPPRCSTT